MQVLKIVSSHLKLFLDMASRSSAGITRTLGGCFRGGFVQVWFRFVNKAKEENPQRCGDVFLHFGKLY